MMGSKVYQKLWLSEPWNPATPEKSLRNRLDLIVINVNKIFCLSPT